MKQVTWFGIIKDQFNLNIDREDEDVILEDVIRGSELRGANLWVLVFAILIASIGLNVNSTAVIIGAMLISPLMGPLIAIGVGLSINDFDMIKIASKNLGFALTASLVTSTFYFLLTPLNQAQTEILARTTPTIFDVFIAFFGGLAGMVANTRKSKGNVLPGVAIATALMPPICTAGYGLATGSWNYFFGAIYLYFINCVFIFFGTFLIVKTMRFHKKTFIDKGFEKRIKRYISAIILVTILPSIYMAYSIVQKSFQERQVNTFLANEISSRGLVVVDKKITQEDQTTLIKLSVLGASISEEFNQELQAKLKDYDLTHTQLIINDLGQSSNKTDLVAIKTGIIEELYRNNENLLKDKDQRIAFLEQQLAALQAQNLPVTDILNEMKIQLPGLEDLILAKVQTRKDPETETSRTTLLAYLKMKSRINSKDLQKTSQWLTLRTKSDDTKIIIDKR